MFLALDVSGSMGSGAAAGVPRLTPYLASAAMALVTAAAEKQHAFVLAHGGSTAFKAVSDLPFGHRLRAADAVGDGAPPALRRRGSAFACGAASGGGVPRVDRATPNAVAYLLGSA
jgi:hypothetical protein